jgi:hypothetical protein
MEESSGVSGGAACMVVPNTKAIRMIAARITEFFTTPLPLHVLQAA